MSSRTQSPGRTTSSSDRNWYKTQDSERDAFGAQYSVVTGMKTDCVREQIGNQNNENDQIFNKCVGSKKNQIRASLEDFELEFNKRVDAYI